MTSVRPGVQKNPIQLLQFGYLDYFRSMQLLQNITPNVCNFNVFTLPAAISNKTDQ
ncbi:hypothetical protein KC19_VG075900 [Ceratodon purpureus]|uniref:Uncharacterized protein n=1 Tax=Ceratodon purpureus TaxID=3225 RepID=A0A8T0HN13_CERPU|nr:hypothetical protein KC19_VG075900 [Ceratodon purpureus]